MRKWESEYDSSQGVRGRLFGREGMVKDNSKARRDGQRQSKSKRELPKRIQKLGEVDGDTDGESERDLDPDSSGRCQTMTKTFRRLKTTERQKGDVF